MVEAAAVPRLTGQWKYRKFMISILDVRGEPLTLAGYGETSYRWFMVPGRDRPRSEKSVEGLRRGEDVMKRGSAFVSVIILVILGLMPSTILGADAAGRFDDVPDDHLFAEDIKWLAGEGITVGCNPPENTLFCPDDNVTRGQMAAFLVRGLNLIEGGPSFDDTAGHIFEEDISELARAGITLGCNPPDNTEFCPDDNVTRGQMAAFLVRGLGITEGGPSFDDTAGHIFEQDISKLAQAGITLGCNPPDNTEFCPDDNVTRAQMAAFLHRGLDEAPPPTTTTTTTSTTSTTSSTTSTSSTTTTTTPTDPNEVTWTCAETGTSWSCEGNIDRSDPAIETWTCSADGDCSGNVDKSDAAAEMWSCEEMFGDTFCEGNVDKTGI
ncbi:MAG: hypothetical protein GEU79_19025, partial [Acidimicrobiia bacterium]|nr:hypothetical protein [Acidimicrobiia bacterium]